MLSSGRDQMVKLWNIETFTCLKALKEFPSSNSFSIAFSPDCLSITFSSIWESIKVYDVMLDNHLMILKGHSDSVYSVDYSPDSKYLASTSADKRSKYGTWKLGLAC
jgi:WD40 repeat protein